MMQLPTELWLAIFDIVIADGIIHCDPTTFPYIQAYLASTTLDHQFYKSYYRLRLVCRRFNTLLGAPPWQSFSDSPLPLLITTRALSFDLDAFSNSDFQLFLKGTVTCGRLVHLDVQFGSSESSDRLDLSDFLCVGLVFRSVHRLTLSPFDWPTSPEVSTWAHLNHAFPFLTTFITSTHRWNPAKVLQSEESDELVCFEKLETLYLSGQVTCLGCHFPRLRNASVCNCSQNQLETFLRSPHLESLLIRSDWIGDSIDVSSCARLKLLGLPHCPSTGVVPIGCDHPVEHIWLYTDWRLGNPKLIKQLSKRLPKISRITVELLPFKEWPGYRRMKIDELRRIKFDAFGLTMRPVAIDDDYLIIERDSV